MLNYIWIAFFLIALVVAVIKTLLGEVQVFSQMVNATFGSAETAFNISIGLTGILCLWMGLMKVGEKGGAIQGLSRIVGPFLTRLFPGVPVNHPARGSMLMNIAANMLGLDNAATPAGLKAMNELQELNPTKDTASNAQIMFLVLNTSGLTLIPITVMTYRKTFGAANPADVFLPILIATFVASVVGLITVALYQRINLFDKVILGYLGVMTTIIVGMIAYFMSLSPEDLEWQSALFSNLILYGIISLFILMAFFKKVNVYEAFIEGAKGGFDIAIKIIPYLVAILVAIAVFRESGAMGYLSDGFSWFFGLFLPNTDFVEGIPTALMKPLSGSGARGMMLSTMEVHGVDSFAGRLAATLQGATDTTFYIIAVYFGAVGITKTRYAIKAGLLADLGGIVAAILVSYLFFATDSPPRDNSSTRNSVEIVNEFVKAQQTFSPVSHLLATDCAFFDQAFDTIYRGTEPPIGLLYFTPNSALLTIKEVEGKIYTKIKGESATHAYCFFVENEQISSIQLLGNFTPIVPSD
jgi:spore maturation protein SpmA